MDKNGKKDFRGWIKIKEKVDSTGIIRSIKEGDVWWSSVGENVGTEICGKGKTFVRPVLVFRKLNDTSFWAIPLTSKAHRGSWYKAFEFNGKKQVAVLSQIRNMSVSRLYRKTGELTKGDYAKIFKAFLHLLCNKKIHPNLKD